MVAIILGALRLTTSSSFGVQGRSPAVGAKNYLTRCVVPGLPHAFCGAGDRRYAGVGVNIRRLSLSTVAFCRAAFAYYFRALCCCRATSVFCTVRTRLPRNFQHARTLFCHWPAGAPCGVTYRLRRYVAHRSCACIRRARRDGMVEEMTLNSFFTGVRGRNGRRRYDAMPDHVPETTHISVCFARGAGVDSYSSLPSPFRRGCSALFSRQQRCLPCASQQLF